MLDLQSKIIGDKLSEILGQPFIRVHKPGAGTLIGVSYAVKAKPDGYTVGIATTSSMVFSPIVTKTDYKLEDFVPLGIFAKGMVHLYVRADAKWKTLQDFVREAKERSGQLKVSSYGKLTVAEFVIEEFSKQAGIKLIHIPYKSCSEALTALLGKHVDADFCTTSVGQLEGGAVKVLAVGDSERSKVLPDAKTFKEQGYPVSLPMWYSFFVPRKTPKKIVDTLSNAMQEAFVRYPEEINEGLKRLEVSPIFFNPQESMQKFKAEHESIFKMAKELGVVAK
jgi:tripartite-type tricarboxylate transporter receptor subunit TctC